MVLTGTGIRVARNGIPSALNPAPGHYFDRAWSLPADWIHLGKWTGMRVSRPLLRFGKPACVYQHLCPKRWNPVLESHQPLQFCKPPPELLGQRDRKLNDGRKLMPPPAMISAFYYFCT